MFGARQAAKGAGLWLLCLSLAACTAPEQGGPPVQRPQVAPAAPALPLPPLPPSPPVAVISVQNESSSALATYYRGLQNDLLAQGMLRQDGGGADTPFTDTMLARNFVRIALFDEYVSDGDTLRAQTTASHLRRWEQPVRMAVEFGDAVPAAQRAKDSATIAKYSERLSRVSGLPIEITSQNPNFHVLVLTEQDRLGYADRLRQIIPDISAGSLRALLGLPRDQLCIVIAFSKGNSPRYSRAVALVRAEHPDLLRRSCYHEELAQGLGLANDSPQARPSIFNDDEEFALLTTHDELLLKMLYDPRMRAGMTPQEAAPVARQIARELRDSGPS